MQVQQRRMGLSYDWDRMVSTCDPEYYRWNQWFFIKFFEKGLPIKRKHRSNWCPSCGTVLANEQGCRRTMLAVQYECGSKRS